MNVLSFFFLHNIISIKTAVTFVCVVKSRTEFHKFQRKEFLRLYKMRNSHYNLIIFHAQNICEGTVRAYFSHAHAYSYFAPCASAFG